MPGGALPSGADIELFLTRLMYKFYISKKKGNVIEISEDAEQGGETCDDSGGSVAKAAGVTAFTDEGAINDGAEN